jgi:hypothetical protein
MRAKLAEWLGGSPEDYKHLPLAFWALTHGTSMLLISKAVRDDLSLELLRSREAAVMLLVKNASLLWPRSEPALVKEPVMPGLTPPDVHVAKK